MRSPHKSLACKPVASGLRCAPNVHPIAPFVAYEAQEYGNRPPL